MDHHHGLFFGNFDHPLSPLSAGRHVSNFVLIWFIFLIHADLNSFKIWLTLPIPTPKFAFLVF